MRYSACLWTICGEDVSPRFLMVSITTYACSELYGILAEQFDAFDRHANLKCTHANRHFGCRGYYVDTIGKYETKCI